MSDQFSKGLPCSTCIDNIDEELKTTSEVIYHRGQCKKCIDASRKNAPSRNPESAHDYYLLNRQKRISYAAEYRVRHPERESRRSFVESNRTHRKRFIGDIDPGNFEFDEWMAMIEFCKGLCVGCGAEEKLTIDHVRPLNQGGLNIKENIQPLCRPCNTRKRSREIDYRPREWIFPMTRIGGKPLGAQ